LRKTVKKNKKHERRSHHDSDICKSRKCRLKSLKWEENCESN
jgi:hypothetical protein